MKIKLGNNLIDCFEAWTPEEHTIGLSETSELHQGSGMVFFFENPSWHTFWMPTHMAFPLDIVFIESGKVVKIYNNCPPGSRMRYASRCDTVVEVPAGYCRRHNIAPGAIFRREADDGFETSIDEIVAMQSSDVLRGLTTAELYAMKEESDKIAQSSTESDPYSRAPSVAPSNAPSDRFRHHDLPSGYVEDGGPAVTSGPIHDESWNSPTRA